MPLRDFVNINIALDSIGIARAGFGLPLILSANASFPERLRFYSDIPGLAVDWPTDSPEYLAGSLMFSQGNRPLQIAIGRSVNKPTQQYAIAITNLIASTKYQMRVRGQNITDTTVVTQSTSSPTLEGTHNSIAANLNAVTGRYVAAFAPLVFTPAVFTATFSTSTFTLTAHGLFTGDGPLRPSNTGGALPAGLNAATNYWVIKIDANTFKLATSAANAFAGTNVTITDNGTGQQTLTAQVTATSPNAGVRVTGAAPGNYFSIELLDTAGLDSSLATDNMSIAQVHVDPGVTADLNAIAASNGSWYALYTLYNSQAYVAAASTWTEGQPRIYIADTLDSHTIAAAAGSVNDIGDQLAASKFSRTLLEYHPSIMDLLGAALEGEVLPLPPGSETWAFKQLVGPRGVSLTATHRANLRARNMNSYEPQTPDLTWSWDGKTPEGEYLDTVRGLDSVQDDAIKSIAEVLANNPKVPYTDGGAVTLGSELEGVFARAVTSGVFSADPAPVVAIPRVATQTAANRRIRRFSGLKGTAQLASAIQDLDITISVTQ